MEEIGRHRALRPPASYEPAHRVCGERVLAGLLAASLILTSSSLPVEAFSPTPRTSLSASLMTSEALMGRGGWFRYGRFNTTAFVVVSGLLSAYALANADVLAAAGAGAALLKATAPLGRPAQVEIGTLPAQPEKDERRVSKIFHHLRKYPPQWNSLETIDGAQYAIRVIDEVDGYLVAAPVVIQTTEETETILPASEELKEAVALYNRHRDLFLMRQELNALRGITRSMLATEAFLELTTKLRGWSEAEIKNWIRADRIGADLAELHPIHQDMQGWLGLYRSRFGPPDAERDYWIVRLAANTPHPRAQAKDIELEKLSEVQVRARRLQESLPEKPDVLTILGKAGEIRHSQNVYEKALTAAIEKPLQRIDQRAESEMNQASLQADLHDAKAAQTALLRVDPAGLPERTIQQTRQPYLLKVGKKLQETINKIAALQKGLPLAAILGAAAGTALLMYGLQQGGTPDPETVAGGAAGWGVLQAMAVVGVGKRPLTETGHRIVNARRTRPESAPAPLTHLRGVRIIDSVTREHGKSVAYYSGTSSSPEEIHRRAQGLLDEVNDLIADLGRPQAAIPPKVLWRTFREHFVKFMARDSDDVVRLGIFWNHAANPLVQGLAEFLRIPTATLQTLLRLHQTIRKQEDDPQAVRDALRKYEPRGTRGLARRLALRAAEPLPQAWEDSMTDENESDAESLVWERERRETLDRMMDKLTPRQRLALEYLYGFRGDPETLERVGERLNVTKERIRQLEAGALRQLRQPARARYLREFLESLKRDRAIQRAGADAAGTPTIDHLVLTDRAYYFLKNGLGVARLDEVRRVFEQENEALARRKVIAPPVLNEIREAMDKYDLARAKSEAGIVDGDAFLGFDFVVALAVGATLLLLADRAAGTGLAGATAGWVMVKAMTVFAVPVRRDLRWVRSAA